MLEAVGQSQVNQQMMEMKTSTGGGGVQDKQFNLARHSLGDRLGAGRSYTESEIPQSVCTTYHLSLIRVIEPFQQLNAGAFATPTASNKSQGLPWIHRHGETIQNLDIRSRRICKFAVNKVNLPLEVAL